MKKVAGFILVLAFSSSVFATEEKVVESVRAVCQSPSQQGKYWNVEGKGDAGANALIRLIGVSINGEASFTKGEWEGVQQVLKSDQHKDNARYWDCIEKLTPLFLEKFAPAKPVQSNKRKTDSTQKTKSVATNHPTPTPAKNTPAIGNVTGDQNVTGNTTGGDMNINFGVKP